MRVSVIIPAFNEEGNIGRLVEETLQNVPDDNVGEVVVVDDCSDDGTADEVKALISANPKVRYIRHQVRSGQSAALRTGIEAARCDIIATMDGDGQNDPSDIPNLLARIAAPGTQGPALVGGVRAKRKASGSKRYASLAANWIRDTILNDGCPDTGCGIKVFWRDAFLRLPFFTSVHRYLPAFFITYGLETAYVPVNDRPRIAGESKYTNFGRALVGLYDLVGVTWLRRRTRVPGVAEDSAGGGSVSSFPTREADASSQPLQNAGE